MKSNIQYNNSGQGEANHAEYRFMADQMPGQTMNLSPHLPGSYAAPNNQGGFPVWPSLYCWVSYAGEDELHVTFALRRFA